MALERLSPLLPAWPAPANVRALVTTRAGGASAAPWASLNLGDHVGDDATAVAENRRRLRTLLPAEPVWLRQVHGTDCVSAEAATVNASADAASTRQRGIVCAVLTADCLPVLFCDVAGTVVAVAHAGWRGLAAGVLEHTVAAMQVAPENLMAWIGPGIGPRAFEVGDDVRRAFVAQMPDAEQAFVAKGGGKFWCDLPLLARQRLAGLGIRRLASADLCTYGDAERFYSYRRDGVTGRFASLIWLD